MKESDNGAAGSVHSQPDATGTAGDLDWTTSLYKLRAHFTYCSEVMAFHGFLTQPGRFTSEDARRQAAENLTERAREMHKALKGSGSLFTEAEVEAIILVVGYWLEDEGQVSQFKEFQALFNATADGVKRRLNKRVGGIVFDVEQRLERKGSRTRR